MSLFCWVNLYNVRSWQVTWVFCQAFVLCQTTCPVKFPHCTIICPCSNALHLRLIVLSPPTVFNLCLLSILCQLMFTPVWEVFFSSLPVWLLTHMPLFQPNWKVWTVFRSLHSEFPSVLNFIRDIKKKFLLMKKLTLWLSMINVQVVRAFLFLHVETGH